MIEQPINATGHYFDGEVALAHPVQVELTADALRINGAGSAAILWPLDRVRLLPDLAGGDRFVYRLEDDPVARLHLSDAALLRYLPHARIPEPVGDITRIVKWAAAAIASVALIIFVLVPVMADQLARFIPPEGERALGEVTLSQIRTALDQTGFTPVETCDDPAGRAALRKLEDRLTTALESPQPLSVLVLDHEMVNAFALPGGYVVFFRGLIKAAERPEEVAAVFAHEIGHVISRDPTRNALRSAGSIGVLGLLFGDFAGGTVVLFLAERLIEAGYTREAETGADIFAHDLLLRAGVAPAALADMFERLRDLYGDADPFVAHFLSHPALGDRIAAARAATPGDFRATPLLSDDEWQALRAICD